MWDAVLKLQGDTDLKVYRALSIYFPWIQDLNYKTLNLYLIF